MNKRILIFQLDGKIPNLAVMRLVAHHRGKGDSVEVIWNQKTKAIIKAKPDKVYASAIFTKTQPIIKQLLETYPNAIIGGTGTINTQTLKDLGVETTIPDYSDYPDETRSIGFTQRGCRLRCKFCVVPEKEGAIQEDQAPHSIWRGLKYPKHLLLLDNDFFGQPKWEQRVADIVTGGFKVSLNQGINVRLIKDEQAKAMSSMDYRDEKMKNKRIYTAWDNSSDQKVFFRGCDLLMKHGVKPHHLMVYVLVGFNSDLADAHKRVQEIIEFGAKPYPMPYVRTQETMGFQRWIIRRYYQGFSWAEFKAAKYRPENLGSIPNG